jgi:hypothetical protein
MMEEVATGIGSPQQEWGHPYAFHALRAFSLMQINRNPPRPLEVALEVGSQARVWWIMRRFFTHGSTLRDLSTQCGREDSNLQPVSRPNPKFDAGSSGQSGAVRLVPVCAAQSWIGAGIRPVRRAFVLASAAGFVRSFVRSQGRAWSLASDQRSQLEEGLNGYFGATASWCTAR